MSVSGLTIEVRINGNEAGPEVRRIVTAFERAGDELRDFGKHVFPKLQPLLEAEAERQFDAEGGGPSGSWPALSLAYAAWKERAFPGNPINVRTSALKDALTNSSSPFARRETSSDTFVYGSTNVPYASHVQLGTRPVVDLSSDFERDLQQAVGEAVRDTVKEAGLDEFAEVRP